MSETEKKIYQPDYVLDMMAIGAAAKLPSDEVLAAVVAEISIEEFKAQHGVTRIDTQVLVSLNSLQETNRKQVRLPDPRTHKPWR